MMHVQQIISVIVPLYYGEVYIPAILSQLELCAKQVKDYKIQLILYNDSPQQKIEDSCHSSIIEIKIIHPDMNGGIHKARVGGFQNSEGNFILFLDQDDRICPSYFSSQLSRIGIADAVVCGALSGGRRKYNLDRPLCKTVSRQSMVSEGNMILSPGQVLLRREAVPKCWIKNILQYNGADDWLLWLCMHSEERQFAVNQDELFFREIHYHNASSDSREMSLSEQEVVRILEENYLLNTEERKTLKKLLLKLQENRVKENEKWKQMFLILNDWFQIYSRGKSVARYLEEQNIKKAAIYGYGYMGKTLLNYLKNEKVEVAYIIDKNAEFLDLDVKCCTLDDHLQSVDGVIISLTKDSLGIENEIKEKLETNVIWLEDIILRLK